MYNGTHTLNLYDGIKYASSNQHTHTHIHGELIKSTIWVVEYDINIYIYL